MPYAGAVMRGEALLDKGLVISAAPVVCLRKILAEWLLVANLRHGIVMQHPRQVHWRNHVCESGCECRRRVLTQA
jgi:hypothetical protein